MKEYYINWRTNSGEIKKKLVKGIPLLKLSKQCGFDMFYRKNNRGFVITDTVSGSSVASSLWLTDAKEVMLIRLKKYGKRGLIKEVKRSREMYKKLEELVEYIKEERYD